MVPLTSLQVPRMRRDYGLELIVGPMFAGKTTAAMQRLDRSLVLGEPMVMVKPNIDNRYSADEVVTHSGYKMPARVIGEPKDLYGIARDYPIIAIDEVQFFSGEIVDVLNNVARNAYVIAAGLNRDYTGRWFPLRDSNKTMADIVEIADKVTWLSAYCMHETDNKKCGRDAAWTQRIVESDSTVLLGSQEEYQPRCRIHYEVK